LVTYALHYAQPEGFERKDASTEIEGESGGMEHSLHDISLIVITHRCSEEIRNYYRRLQSDERFCLEIFRRALIDGDNDAWVALQEHFTANVMYWLRRHPQRREALEIEPEQNYVDDTFMRLWQWGYNQKTNFNHLAEFNSQTGFDSLAGALRFLYDCLNTLILDKLRRRNHQKVIPLTDIDPPIPSTSEAHILQQEFWSKIRVILTDDREYRIIFLAYHDGLKPRQIPQLCPDEFDDIKEVRRLMKNAVDRLRRHDDILRVLLVYDDIEQ